MYDVLTDALNRTPTRRETAEERERRAKAQRAAPRPLFDLAPGSFGTNAVISLGTGGDSVIAPTVKRSERVQRADADRLAALPLNVRRHAEERGISTVALALAAHVQEEFSKTKLPVQVTTATACNVCACRAEQVPAVVDLLLQHRLIARAVGPLGDTGYRPGSAL